MKNSQKRRLFFYCIFLWMLVFLAGCKDNEDPLIGMWQEPSSGITLEFGENNDLIMGNKGTTVQVSYTKQDPDVIIIQASTDGSIPDQSMNYRIDGSNLIVTVDGIETVFNRVE